MKAYEKALEMRQKSKESYDQRLKNQYMNNGLNRVQAAIIAEQRAYVPKAKIQIIKKRQEEAKIYKTAKIAE